jgi:hypothetical protein
MGRTEPIAVRVGVSSIWLSEKLMPGTTFDGWNAACSTTAK